MTDRSDASWMAQAIGLAWRGAYTTAPNPRVGCVLVRDDHCVGEGFHQRAGEPHAEVFALRQAGRRAAGATAYVTLEPCSHHGRTPPCADALIEAGVARVVVAMQDPDPRVSGRGIERLRVAGVEVSVGCLETQARDLNPGFLSRISRRRPWLRLKLAGSLDGRSAMANGESQWITGPQSRRDVHHWRACSDAMITGVGTVLADDPMLNARDIDGDCHQPALVVLDSHWRTPLDSRLLQRADVAIVGLGKPPAELSARARCQSSPAEHGRVALPALLDWMFTEGWSELMVEAGATLAGAFLRAGLIDELLLYQAPLLMGHQARPLLSLDGMQHLQDALRWRRIETQEFGDDLRWRLTPL
jgi:diaminohydroxyphosphoribosylaminopyrimidine deaminase/5-amino-6-(5-phosphoribosylamino)uracil reductase